MPWKSTPVAILKSPSANISKRATGCPGRGQRILLIRQTYRHRDREQAASIRIERLDAGRPPAPGPRHRCRPIRQGWLFFGNTTRLFSDWSHRIAAQPNSLPLWDQAFCQSVGGDPNILYYHGHFDLAADEAMVITLPAFPTARPGISGGQLLDGVPGLSLSPHLHESGPGRCQRRWQRLWCFQHATRAAATGCQPRDTPRAPCASAGWELKHRLIPP